MAKDLLFELGCEDLPPMQIEGALAEFAQAFIKAAAAQRIAHGELESYTTPRRLTLLVREVAERQEDLEETRVGPPVSAAYRDGSPTKALAGFLRGAGKEETDVFRVTQEKKKGKPAEYVAVKVRQEGIETRALLVDLLNSLPAAIHWPKSMHWGSEPTAFARPVHWLLARFGDEILPVAFADAVGAPYTYGHRFHAPEAIELDCIEDYKARLEQAKVLVDVAQRRARIAEVARAAATSAGGVLIEDEDLLDEIVHLVEWPVAVVGRFDEAFLALPQEVLLTSMKKHQRFFGLVDKEGKAMARFVTIANTEPRDKALVAKGNERVLLARLKDAEFFYREDQKHSLDDWAAKLERVTYVDGLGSVAHKAQRLVAISGALADKLYPEDAALKADLQRAAALCKADLATGMVYEFPELQGFVGGTYARNAGEAEAVATAITEHYLPRGAGDEVPQSPAGALLAIADRVDSIAALFALGRIPTGAADPFALRRAALGILRMVLDQDLRIEPQALIEIALAAVAETRAKLGEPAIDAPAIAEEMARFILTRMRHFLMAEYDTEVVDAVLAIGVNGLEDFSAALARVKALAAIRGGEDFEPIAVTFKRVANILGDTESSAVDTERFEEAAEEDLYEALQKVASKFAAELEGRDFDAALASLVSLREPVDVFFDAVLVNAPDEAVRANRHALLHAVLTPFKRFADVRRL